MKTPEQLDQEPSLEQRLETKVDEILATQSLLPPSPHWPRYFNGQSRKTRIFGIVSDATIGEGAVIDDKNGKRVDVRKVFKQTTVLGAKRPEQKIVTVAKYDNSVESVHKVRIDLSGGQIDVFSQAQKADDSGQLTFERPSFKKGTPEYETTLNSTFNLLAGLSEAS